MNYKKQYGAYLALIEKELSESLERIQEKNIVYEAMRYALLSGGKRVRPVLALAFCEMLGGKPENALIPACAIEMIHSSSLIHDDLPCMDDDDLRRGKPSCHKQFGEAFGLLAGDALLNYAYETLFGSALSVQIMAKCGQILAAAAGIDGMMGGQTIDLQSENKSPDLETLQKLHSLKTGRMLTAPCMIGVICAGGNETQIQKAQFFGDAIGLQFQIIDDILDVTGTAEELGKPVGSDEDNCKSTYVSLMGLDEARKQADALTQQALEVLSEFGDKADFLKEMTLHLCNRTK